MQRLLAAVGLTTMRSLVLSWIVSGVVLLVGLLLVVTGASTGVGFVLFVLGAAGVLMVAFGMLSLRAAERDRGAAGR